MKKLLLILLFLITLYSSGCMSEAKIDSVLSTCPQYVRDNVGEIKYMPISWGTAMLMSGVTDKRTGEIWLAAWADEHTILHEAGHSVYFRTPHSDFDAEFRKKRGFVSVWSLNYDETVAEAFYGGMIGRSNPKIDCAMRFFRGR